MKLIKKQRIMRVTQSPMNAVIWVLDLECGHELTVVQKRRPSKYSLTHAPDGELLQGYRRVNCTKCSETKEP